MAETQQTFVYYFGKLGMVSFGSLVNLLWSSSFRNLFNLIISVVHQRMVMSKLEKLVC